MQYTTIDYYNKKFFVKIINKDRIDNIDTLFSHIEMLRKLEHPYIRKCYGVAEDNTHFYIIDEFIEGIDLKMMAKKAGGVLTVKDAVKYSIQIAEALQYTHSFTPSIINCDINPSNIFIDINDNVKLVNFNSAIVYIPGCQVTTCLDGTRGYAPPERYYGEVTPRTDIYSLGIVMHQMLTGVDPGKPPYETPHICSINSLLPRKLDYIISKCTKVNPDERYQNCGDLIRDLKNVFPGGI